MDEIIQNISKEDPNIFKNLANKYLELAVKFKDKVYGKKAILCYCIYKILTKSHLKNHPMWKRIVSLIKSNYDLDDILIKIYELDKDYGYYVKNIVEKAKIKLASSAYALGLSSLKSAEIFETSLFELIPYIGKIKIHDEDRTNFGIKERLAVLLSRINK
jgi:hypothetical protein